MVYLLIAKPPVLSPRFHEALKYASELHETQTRKGSGIFVSAADKLHNSRATLRDLQSEGASVWGRFSATREQTLGNYRELIEIY